MKVDVPLSTDDEVRLREQAQAAGKDISRFIYEALQEKLAVNGIGPLQNGAADVDVEQRIAELRAWAASHSPLPFEADDSRDGIYEGRGE